MTNTFKHILVNLSPLKSDQQVNLHIVFGMLTQLDSTSYSQQPKPKGHSPRCTLCCRFCYADKLRFRISDVRVITGSGTKPPPLVSMPNALAPIAGGSQACFLLMQTDLCSTPKKRERGACNWKVTCRHRLSFYIVFFFFFARISIYNKFGLAKVRPMFQLL